MKKNLMIVFWVVALLGLFVAIPGFGEEKKFACQRETAALKWQWFDANQIGLWFVNNGNFCRDPITGNAGFEYPIGSGKFAVYVAALWLAGKVNGQVCTACAGYATEFQGGVILPNGQPDDPALEKYRIYKIKAGDSADPSSPNYNPDYSEWPAADGAPLDAAGNPLILGDQTLWFVMNDANSYLHEMTYNTLPLKIEVQVLAWAFDEETTPLGKTVFIQYTLINKNVATIEDAYIGLFVDADLGDANDDKTACDTTLNLSYNYNEKDNDAIYGIAVPAVGVCLLQGPTVTATRDLAPQAGQDLIFDVSPLQITSNSVYYCGHERFREPAYSADGAQRLYGNFLGCDYFGDPTVNPVTGQPNKFMNCGDPILNTGWLDNFCGDTRFMQGCGAFDLAPQDTQRVVYAVIIGHDANRLSSVLDLRKNTSYVDQTFRSNFQPGALAEVEIDYLSATETEVTVLATINSDQIFSSATAAFFDYTHQLIHSLELFDDGERDNGFAGDNIFGNCWLTSASEKVLYLDLNLTDATLTEQRYQFAAYNLTLSDRLAFSGLTVVDDHINNDKKINPGENVRLNFSFINNYSFPLKKVHVTLKSDDPWVEISPGVAVFDSIAAGEPAFLTYDLYDETTFFSMNVAPDMPDRHTIYFSLQIADEQFHLWKKVDSLQVEPLEYLPNLIIPAHVSGRSDSYFAIRIINPSELTGHNYVITVSDSINESREKGFNLIDQTLGTTILLNQEVPVEYAYNVPITDGFKVAEAYLPEGSLQDVVYENIPGGNETGFAGVGYGAPYFSGGVFLGLAPKEEIWAVELVFANRIDSSGVVGTPNGQGCFRYQMGLTTGPTGFYPGSLQAWKVSQGERINLLNVCFQENLYFSRLENLWAPDASILGGMETLYIMKSDYDPTGQIYLGQDINLGNVMYKICLRLASETAIVDAGDKMIFKWEAAATSEDVFSFVPTSVSENKPVLPEKFALFQNYPNPFNPETTIEFSVAVFSRITLKIYNLLGQEVNTLVDRTLSPGQFSVLWNGKDAQNQQASSGLYFARLKCGAREQVIKMLLLR